MFFRSSASVIVNTHLILYDLCMCVLLFFSFSLATRCNIYLTMLLQSIVNIQYLNWRLEGFTSHMHIAPV